jgi:hypothetical protein
MIWSDINSGPLPPVVTLFHFASLLLGRDDLLERAPGHIRTKNYGGASFIIAGTAP